MRQLDEHEVMPPGLTRDGYNESVECVYSFKFYMCSYELQHKRYFETLRGFRSSMAKCLKPGGTTATVPVLMSNNSTPAIPPP